MIANIEQFRISKFLQIIRIIRIDDFFNSNFSKFLKPQKFEIWIFFGFPEFLHKIKLMQWKFQNIHRTKNRTTDYEAKNRPINHQTMLAMSANPQKLVYFQNF